MPLEFEKKALLTQKDEISAACERCSHSELVAVDTEFIRETTFFPKMALIQLATEKECWLMDPLSLDKAAICELTSLLTNERILKVFHSRFGDQECFFRTYGLLVTPCFDTSVGAALLGLGENIGLGKLTKEVLGVTLPKGRARANWLLRPLPDELKEYAVMDVKLLVKLAGKLISQLRNLSRLDWALEESKTDPTVFDIPPRDSASKMAKGSSLDPLSYAVLIELVRWREKRARTSDVPRYWVAKNETLIALSQVRPRSRKDLSTFRGLNPKELERSGEEILAAIDTAIKQPRESLTQPPAVFFPTKEEELSVHLIQAFIAYLSAHHRVASRFLMNSENSTRLIRSLHERGEKWVERGILSSHALTLIGDDLRALLSGKMALSLENGGVKVVSL